MADFYTKFWEFARLPIDSQIQQLGELVEHVERPDHIRCLAGLPARIKNTECFTVLFRSALKRVNFRISCCAAKRDFAKDLVDFFHGQPKQQMFFKRYFRMLTRCLHREGIKPAPAKAPPRIEGIQGRVWSKEIRSEREWEGVTLH